MISHSHKQIHSLPFYVIIFVAPFFEELLFRLSLKLNKLNVSIFFGLLSYLIFGGKIISLKLINFNFLGHLLVALLLFCVFYYFFSSTIIKFLYEYKKIIIAFSIFSFGIIHVFNMDKLYWQLFLFYPFYVLPQMIMGYFISNLRLKYGFMWGLMLHILINTFSVFLSHS
jgi:hypothetical protein